MDAINYILSTILSLAIKEMFPKAILMGSKASSSLFFCDFSFSGELDAPIRRELEERVLFFLKQNRPMCLREMIPFSAQEYFYSVKEPVLAQQAEACQYSTFSLIDLEGKFFPFPSNIPLVKLPSFASISLFQQEVIPGEGGGIRLYGRAFSTKEERKEFLKNTQSQVAPSHLQRGREQHLFWWEEGKVLWLPKGVFLRKKILYRLEKVLRDAGGVFLESVPAEQDASLTHWAFFRQQGEKRGLVCETRQGTGLEKEEEGLLLSNLFLENCSHLFCKKNLLQKEVISSLHFMTKIFRMLGFAWEIVLVNPPLKKGSRDALEESLLSSLLASELSFREERGRVHAPKIEWRVRDRLGVFWPVSCLYAPRYIEKKRSDVEDDVFVCLPMAPFLSLERVFALMIENRLEIVNEEYSSELQD